jgi:hypothetical protein
MKKKLIVLGSVFGLTPMLALAATVGTANGCSNVGLGTISGIVCKIGDILNLIVPVLIVLAVIFFIWGVIMYVIASDEEAKKAGRDRIIYGIIGLAVIVGVWGLVNILKTTFGFDNSNAGNQVLPTISY